MTTDDKQCPKCGSINNDNCICDGKHYKEKFGTPVEFDDSDDKTLIIQPDDFGANALNAIQQKGDYHPDVITDKSQFQPVYDDYQFVRKFRIAIEKKSKQLVAEEKAKFETGKKIYTDEEKRILSIVVPIEKKLLDTRTVWESKIETEKLETARIKGLKQKAEHERQEKIKTEFLIAEIWDTAHGMNICFDAKKVEEARREADLKERELKIEAREKELETLTGVSWENKNADPVGDLTALSNKIKENKENFDSSVPHQTCEATGDTHEPMFVEDAMTDAATHLEVLRDSEPATLEELEKSERDHEPTEIDACGEYEFICPKCNHKFSVE